MNHRSRVAVILGAGWTVASGSLAAQAEPRCGGAVVRGRVTDASETVAIPGATVIVRWTNVRRRPTRAPSDGDGQFRICAPGDASPVVVWAELGDYSTQHESLAPSDGDDREVTLRMALGALPAARVVGRVYDVETGDPISAATIALIGGHGVAVSDARGNFIVTGLPPGPYTVRVSHLGYREGAANLEATSGRTHEIAFGLVREPLALEPIVVITVRSRKLELRGFYERKFWGEATGLGTFITARDIERRRPLRISHMIADAPGIRLRCRGSGMRACALENRGCANMNAYIDGVPLRGIGSIDDYMLPGEVEGIEIYRGAAQLPAEFGGADARCGAIVIWTK